LCSCTIALLLVPSHFWHSSGSNLVAHSLVIDGCSQPGVRWLCVRTGTLASLPALVGSATFPVGLPCFLPIPMWGPYGVGMAATVPTWDVAPWMVCLLLHLFTCRGRVGGSVSSAFVFAHTLLKSLVRGGFCSLRQTCLHILAALRACLEELEAELEAIECGVWHFGEKSDLAESVTPSKCQLEALQF
jgi:hypothetical protein